MFTFEAICCISFCLFHVPVECTVNKICFIYQRRVTLNSWENLCWKRRRRHFISSLVSQGVVGENNLCLEFWLYPSVVNWVQFCPTPQPPHLRPKTGLGEVDGAAIHIHPLAFHSSHFPMWVHFIPPQRVKLLTSLMENSLTLHLSQD